MMRPTFHMFGITSVFIDRFRRSVRNFNAFGPRCFSIIGAMLFGARALDDLVVSMALLTSSVVKRSESIL